MTVCKDTAFHRYRQIIDRNFLSCEFDLNLNLKVFHYKNLGFLINKMAYFHVKNTFKTYFIVRIHHN